MGVRIGIIMLKSGAKSALCKLCNKEYVYLGGASNLQLISKSMTCDYTKPSFGSIVQAFILEYSPFVYGFE